MRPRTAIVIVLLVVVVAVAGGHAWRWWRHPDALRGYGNAVELNPFAPTGRPVSVMLTSPYGDRETVRIHSARPRTVSNTANAAVRLAVCVPRPDRVRGRDHVETVGYGYAGALSAYCAAVRTISPSTGTTMRLDRDYLLAVVTPRRRGVVTFAGVDVSYSRGWRHLVQTGTERAGLHVTARLR